MKDDMKAIRELEDKYGLVLFRMGFSYLVDVGHSNLGDDEVKKGTAQIMAQAEADRVNGVVTFVTPEFQCEIVRCAAELAQFSIWTLFAYVKKHVVVSD